VIGLSLVCESVTPCQYATFLRYIAQPFGYDSNEEELSRRTEEACGRGEDQGTVNEAARVERRRRGIVVEVGTFQCALCIGDRG
jgi:hypothetical protein